MLSVLLCVKNEEKNLPNCIKSISFADEIVVIDDFSKDSTVEIASELGCTVYQRAMQDDWSGQRNFGISQCHGDWIFVLDADEIVSEKLAEEIRSCCKRYENNPICFWIQRENKFRFNKATHGVLRSDWVLRLFPKASARYEGRVHEKLVTELPTQRIRGAVLYHYTYSNWDAYFNKFNKYTTLGAQQRYEKGKKANFWFDILLRPWFAFFKMYVLERGFLDGKLGFILSVNHFFYTMTKYVKLYYLNRSNGEL